MMSLCFVSNPSIILLNYRNNPIYIKYYTNVTRTVLLGIVPFAALIFFNIKIYQRFVLTRRRYTRNNNSSSQVRYGFMLPFSFKTNEVTALRKIWHASHATSPTHYIFLKIFIQSIALGGVHLNYSV